MITKEIITDSIQIIEYTGDKRPLKFAHILDGATKTKGLTDFVIKDVGLPITKDNIKVVEGSKQYSEAPDIVVTSGGGIGLILEAILDPVTKTIGTVQIVDGGSTVKSVQIVNGGAGYISSPTVTFSGGKVFKEGTETKIEISIQKPEIFIQTVVLKPNTYVWINTKGAYLTQKEEWIFLEDLTNFFTKIDKLYTTTNNGAYISNRNMRLNDVLNQIQYLENGEGYIVVVQPNQSLPFVWYVEENNIESLKYEKIAFDIEECYNINKQNIEFVDNNAKTIRLDQRSGVCKENGLAVISLPLNLTNLKKNTDYYIRLDSTNKDIFFVDQDFYLNNNQLSNYSLYAKIKFTKNTSNSIFNIVVSMNIGANNIDKDILSIYTNCPAPPEQTKNTRLAQPVVRSME